MYLKLIYIETIRLENGEIGKGPELTISKRGNINGYTHGKRPTSPVIREIKNN